MVALLEDMNRKRAPVASVSTGCNALTSQMIVTTQFSTRLYSEFDLIGGRRGPMHSGFIRRLEKHLQRR